MIKRSKAKVRLRWQQIVCYGIAIVSFFVVYSNCQEAGVGPFGEKHKSSFFSEKHLGSLEDTKCNVEVVQEANAVQLASIFGALLNSTFFRLFRVDVEQRCNFFQTEKPEEFRCSAKPADDEPPGISTMFGGSSQSSSSSSSESAPGFGSSSSVPGAAEGEEGASFCSLSPPEEDLNNKITQAEEKASEAFGGASCDDEELPTFWLDMCSTIHTNTSKYINLQLNDERNTGYNGSHIWRAIYEENCVWEAQGGAYEEKVLRRILSGMHASTSISVAWRYTAPRRGNKEWRPSPEHFMKVFGDHPEYLKNVHFTFVVLLRALRRATPFLYHYKYISGDEKQDERTTMLMHHLLDSHLLSLCSAVFDGFDETSLFRSQSSKKEKKRQFKTVFQNITNVVNCVKCQSCRLHAKLHILGIGTALKILLLPLDLLATSIAREEVVAFINTIGAFSESVTRSQRLTELYWDRKQSGSAGSINALDATGAPARRVAVVSDLAAGTRTMDEINGAPALDNAIGLIARAFEADLMSEHTQAILIDLALRKDTGLLSLAWHYRMQPENFAKLAGRFVSGVQTRPLVSHDAIVIGTGLAGLVAALSLMDRGAHVIMIDKETRIGGNSGKASSGINAAPAEECENFYEDTKKSAGNRVTPLLDTFVKRTEDAVEWLKTRVGVNLDNVLQLGGHTEKRTYRPTTGMIGAEVTFAAGNEVKRYIQKGQLTLLLQTTGKKIFIEDGHVAGLHIEDKDGNSDLLRAPTVILASGGFGHDLSSESLLYENRPDLKGFPTTLGNWTTGDGLRMALEAGAYTVDMDKVQLHPTGFVDPVAPNERTKTLCAEVMRGAGGILFNGKMERFVNELGTRQYVVDAMLANQKPYTLILNEDSGNEVNRHTALYSRKGLVKKVEGGVKELAMLLGISKAKLIKELEKYQAAAKNKKDEFGKTNFIHGDVLDLSDNAIWWVGEVTPVVHYTMGGIAIDETGKVLSKATDKPIPGLYAAGEVSGGLHGDNRLAGNSLSECTVFGRIVGEDVPIATRQGDPFTDSSEGKKPKDEQASRRESTTSELKNVDTKLLQLHSKAEDCWIALYDRVYDFTGYGEEHPGGEEAITDHCGKDATEVFAAVHNPGMLADFDDLHIGKWLEATEHMEL